MKTFTFKFDGGANNTAQETGLPRHGHKSRGFARKIVNLDVADDGRLLKRGKLALVKAGTAVHSLWSGAGHTLFCDGSLLYKLGVDTPLATGLSGARLSYTSLADRIFFSNGVQAGVFANGVVRPWGTPTPAQPTLALAAGSLEKGAYKVALTTAGSLDESGSSSISEITLENSGGISVSFTGAQRVYMSYPGGETMYFVGDYSDGCTITTTSSFGKVLQTELLSPVPAGKIVRVFNSRLYVATDNMIYYSMPMRHGYTRLSSNFIMLEDEVLMIEPVLDGLYIGTRKGVSFYAGTDASLFKVNPVSEFAPILGSSDVVSASLFSGDRNEEKAAVWLSERGWTAGFQSGQVIQLSPQHRPVEFAEAYSTSRVRDGISQLLTFGTGGGLDSDASDTISSDIVLNGKIA